MLHKTDKGPVYGVRGVMHFFKEKSRFLPNRKRTHEKTYVFSHALLPLYTQLSRIIEMKGSRRVIYHLRLNSGNV